MNPPLKRKQFTYYNKPKTNENSRNKPISIRKYLVKDMRLMASFRSQIEG